MDKHHIHSEEAVVNGVRIHYRIAGSGLPVILLHGAPQTSHSWRHLVPRLAENYTVIVPDLRGYGQSDKPEIGYEIHTMAEDIRQLLLQLGLKSVSLVGHDLGGIVAYVYAAQHMSEVRRLGIIESPIIGVPSPTMERVLAGYWHIGLYAHPRLPELLISGREREYLSEFIRTYQHNWDTIDESDIAEYARHLASPGGIRGAMGVYRTIATELPAILRLTTKKLTMPVWAIGGEHSMGLGPFEQFQTLARRVQGGIIEQCGHWVMEEQPVRVTADLETFLEKDV